MKEILSKALPVYILVLFSFNITANAQVGGEFQPLPSNQSEINVAGSVQQLPPPSLGQSKAARLKAIADSMNNGDDDRAFWGRQDNTSVTTKVAASSNHVNTNQDPHIDTSQADTQSATVPVSNTAVSTPQKRPIASTKVLYSNQELQAIQKQQNFKERGFMLRVIVIALVIGIVVVKVFSKSTK